MIILSLFLGVLLFAGQAQAADRYWVGSAAGEDWDDNNNWSTAGNSCGVSGGASYPVAGDTAIFTSACTNNITLDAVVTVGAITNSGTPGFYYGGPFTTSNNNVTVSGNFRWDYGTFTAGSSTITVGGSWDSSGGTFTPGTSTRGFDWNRKCERSWLPIPNRPIL